MRTPTSFEPSLANSIIEQIDRVVREAEEAGRPLEIEPFRGRLFELFVMADAADLVHQTPAENGPAENGTAGNGPAENNRAANEPGKPDLTADGLCRGLAQRWNLSDAARESFTKQTRLPPEHLARMRLLWSVMRMWMEWTYAWERWAEFHQEPKPGQSPHEACSAARQPCGKPKRFHSTRPTSRFLLDTPCRGRLESKVCRLGAPLGGPVVLSTPFDLQPMLDNLLERGLYAAMAAVLIVPELATFMVVLGFALGVFVYAGRLVWSLLRDTDQHALAEPTAGTSKRRYGANASSAAVVPLVAVSEEQGGGGRRRIERSSMYGDSTVVRE